MLNICRLLYFLYNFVNSNGLFIAKFSLNSLNLPKLVLYIAWSDNTHMLMILYSIAIDLCIYHFCLNIFGIQAVSLINFTLGRSALYMFFQTVQNLHLVIIAYLDEVVLIF